jgi:3-dehydroquinate synthase
MIIALGGGVVGDIAGWVASFYLRGIDYIQIPTTLVSQVDSSIGGKTGVDIPEGKNLFGAFYQPKAVLTDTYLLNSLGGEKTRNGLGEIIKYAVTLDEDLFNYVERYIKNFVRDDLFLNHVVRKCCEIKANVIEKDEGEKEYRKVLNYGHTIGHAIEASENYRIQHGDCVALGMLYEGKLANKLGIFNDEDLERQNNVINHFWPKYILDSFNYKPDASKLMKFMRRDKKNKSNEIYFVLPARIGEVKEENGKVAFPVDEKIIRGCLKS